MKLRMVQEFAGLEEARLSWEASYFRLFSTGRIEGGSVGFLLEDEVK